MWKDEKMTSTMRKDRLGGWRRSLSRSRSLEVSHLDLNLLKEEFLTGFLPYRGFSLVLCLHFVSLVLVMFTHT